MSQNDLRVFKADGHWWLACGARRYRCAIGRGGVAAQKREGDGATPVGTWPVRRLHYRADRLAEPETALAKRIIAEDDGWCDDPESPAYNRLVKRPLAESHEIMARDDEIYDLVVELGYNDDPPVTGRGSAIFLHVARPGYTPTEGCVALARDDLLAVLKSLRADSALTVEDVTR